MARFSGNRFSGIRRAPMFDSLDRAMLKHHLMSRLRSNRQRPAQAAAQVSQPGAGFTVKPSVMSSSTLGNSSEFTKRMVLDRMYGNNRPGSKYNVKKWLPPNNPMGTIFQRIRDKEREDLKSIGRQIPGTLGSDVPSTGPGLGFPGATKTVRDAMKKFYPAGSPQVY